MERKSIYRMKQPELGKRILALRKQQGLTQEELVEKCNVSVRTIQRIEAGLVMPRNFTIKAIFESLDADLNFEFEGEKPNISIREKKWLNLAWILGIVYFIIGFFETAIDIYQFTDDTSLFNTVSYVSIKIMSLVSFTFLMYGFVVVSDIYKVKLLKVISIIFICFYGASVLYDVLTQYNFEETIALSLIIKSVLFGVLQILFGFSLLQLKPHLGTLVQVNGLLEIVTGVCLATVLLASIGTFLLIPTIILEIFLLYKLSNSLSSK